MSHNDRHYLSENTASLIHATIEKPNIPMSYLTGQVKSNLPPIQTESERSTYRKRQTKPMGIHTEAKPDLTSYGLNTSHYIGTNTTQRLSDSKLNTHKSNNIGSNQYISPNRETTQGVLECRKLSLETTQTQQSARRTSRANSECVEQPRKFSTDTNKLDWSQENSEWNFPSVNYNYYHSRLNVLNASDGNQMKYKSRRNSYDLIKTKCLAILNMDKKQARRSMDDEAYQVSKIITIFDNVGNKQYGKERKEKDNERLKKRNREKPTGTSRVQGVGRKSTEVIGSPKAFRKVEMRTNDTTEDRNNETHSKNSIDEHKETLDRMNTNPDMGTQTETTLASEIVDRRENQAKKQRDPMMNDNVNNNNNNIKTQHFQLIQEMRNIQNQTKREVSGGVREHKTNEEMKSQTREINKTNLNEINKNIKTKSDKEDNKVTKSGKLQEIHKESEYVLEHEESKQTKLHKQYNLQKHVLKTQATIEHVETVHENKESNANVSVRNEHDTRIHRRINMHHRHASISQNISSSHAELFPIVAKPNEKIIKILDSSHFVITKDSLLNKPHDVQSEMDNSQLNRECGREQIQIISHKRQDTNKEDRIQDNLERKPNVEPTIINNNNVDPCEYESMAHEILRSIDNIQSKETQEKYEKIDEEIDVDHGKTIATSRTLRVNKPGVHETHLTDNEQVERAELQLSVRNLQTQVEIRQHSTIPQDETNVENKKKTNKSSEENIQEEQSGNIRSSLQETDQSVKLYEKQIDLSTKQYQIQQARSPPEQQATQYQHSAMRGVRTSASTVTKLSKSSIQEDMLEIWLDHQKFLQRHPEDDSFYSFMFVFFAVFASFVFVLIVYFVMFVV